MKKAVLIVVGLLVLVLLGVVGVGLAYLGPLIKKGVETVGPMVTKVDVTLASANLNLLGGHASLKGLKVGNPPGYQTDAAMKLGEVSLSVAPGSVFADKVHIKSVSIIGPEINLEGGLQENNLGKILENVQAFSGSSTNQTDTAATKKIQLDSFVLRGARVTANLNVPGLQPVSVTLPDIELRDLGQGPEGITSAELTSQVMKLVTSKTIAAVAEYVTTGAGKQLLDSATKSATDAARKAAGDAADKALKGVGDLLRKN